MAKVVESYIGFDPILGCHLYTFKNGFVKSLVLRPKDVIREANGENPADWIDDDCLIEIEITDDSTLDTFLNRVKSLANTFTQNNELVQEDLKR